MEADLFFHLGAIDAGDNLLHQIGKSTIGVGDDEKPIDGRQQQIDLVMDAQPADMGDPFPRKFSSLSTASEAQSLPHLP